MRDRLSRGIVIIIAVILLTGFHTNAWGDNWIYYFDTWRGMHYFDKQSIKKTTSGVHVLELVILSKEGEKETAEFLTKVGMYNGKTIETEITLKEYNCEKMEGIIQKFIYYDVDGNVVAQGPAHDKWKNINPDTVSYKLYKNVCK